jgi:hypothetical protein
MASEVDAVSPFFFGMPAGGALVRWGSRHDGSKRSERATSAEWRAAEEELARINGGRGTFGRQALTLGEWLERRRYALNSAPDKALERAIQAAYSREAKRASGGDKRVG